MLDTASKKSKFLPRVGAAIRYNETGSRWFIATLRKVSATDVEIEYLWGKRESVPTEKVEDFASHLRNRKHVLSLTGENLCYVFYGEHMTRLRQKRIDAMQRFLCRHGFRFEPVDWRADTRIRIWPDESNVTAETSAADHALEALLPNWLEPHRLPAGSRDPLGFQNFAEGLANTILPGLTVFTSRIGYYGLIAWAVREINGKRPNAGISLRDHFQRIERAYVLCEFIHHGAGSDDCRVLGQRSKSEVLQSAQHDRFLVPARILKNQTSAGALRLYMTSMQSLGFAELRPELGADGLLPLAITDLGQRLAHEFGKRVPEGFLEFALSDRARHRHELREWGRRLCISGLGEVRYRVPFLEGFLLGNSEEATVRYHTVNLLFNRKLLGEDSTPKTEGAQDALPEEAADTAEEETGSEGLNNASVLLDFYKEAPRPEIALLQKAAAYELLSLALTAIFASAIDVLSKDGHCNVLALRDAIVASKGFGKFWRDPFGTGRLPVMRKLHDALFEAETPVEKAAIGGAILRRARHDPAFAASVSGLTGAPPLSLYQGLVPEKSLAESFGSLMDALVARHKLVSVNKNRERWCDFDPTGRILEKIDPNPLGLGWHSMRFPQLYSLYRDVRLTQKDLSLGP
jgi:hypothetical protein